MKPPDDQHTQWAAAESVSKRYGWYIYNVTTRHVIATGMSEQEAKGIVAEHNGTVKDSAPPGHSPSPTGRA